MDITPITDSPQVAAFRRAIAGYEGQSGYAKRFGLTQSAVSKRLKAGLPIWPEHVLEAETDTGVSRHDLRPDLYPREDVSHAPPPASRLTPRPAGGISSADALEGVRS